MLQARQSRSDVVPTASSPGLIRVHEDWATPVLGPPEEVAEGGIGLSAPLNEAGYQAVAATCCSLQMDFYIHRVIASLGLEMCYEGGLQGFLGWFTCERGVTTFEYMKQKLLEATPPAKCAFVAPGGTCPPGDPDCLGVDQPWLHRRRRCATTTEPFVISQSTTLTASPTTTAAATAPPAATTAAVPETTATPPTNMCTANPVQLNFKGAAVSSNLGGTGPDTGAKEIRYSKIGQVNGVSIDMVITNTSVYSPTPGADRNGKGGGETSATLGIMGGQAVNLHFEFVQSDTGAPVVLPEFHFTALDVDQSKSGKMTELWHFAQTAFDGYVVEPTNEIAPVEAPINGVQSFSSRLYGAGCDNPRDPMNLKVIDASSGCPSTAAGPVDQRRRSFMMFFKNRSGFDVTMESTCAGQCKSGRIFLFTGTSSLVSLCK